MSHPNWTRELKLTGMMLDLDHRNCRWQGEGQSWLEMAKHCKTYASLLCVHLCRLLFMPADRMQFTAGSIDTQCWANCVRRHLTAVSSWCMKSWRIRSKRLRRASRTGRHGTIAANYFHPRLPHSLTLPQSNSALSTQASVNGNSGRQASPRQRLTLTL